MLNLWMRLAGIMRFQQFSIEGDAAGGAGGGAAAGGGGSTGSGGGAGGGGSTTSPAAPTTTPAAEPASPAAPLSTQEVSSSLTDDSGKPVRELGETSEAFLARYRAHQKAHPAVEEPAAKTPEQIAAEKVAEAAKTTPVETPEAKAAREAAERARAGETPEAKAAREKAEKEEADRKAAAEAAGPEIYDLAPVPAEELSAALKKDPAKTLAFLEATGLTEDALLANSKLAGRAAEYMAAGLPTVESAKHAVARAKAFYQIEDSFTNIKSGDLPSTAKFFNDTLMPMTYLRDENGQVMMDPETKLPLTDGSAFTFIDNATDLRHDFWAKQIEKNASEIAIGHVFGSGKMAALLDAVVAAGKKIGGDQGDMIQAAALTLKQCGGKRATSDELSPEVKARLDEADRVKAEAETTKQQTAEAQERAWQTKVTDFKDGVLNESSKGIDKIIGDFLDKSTVGADKFLRDTVIGKIRAALYENMSADPLYLSGRDGISIAGPTPAVHSKLVAFNLNEAKGRLRDVSKGIFAEAGIKILTKSAQRKEQIEGQQKRSQMEARGGTTTALPRAAAAEDKHALIERAKENLRSQGKDIDTASVLAEYRKLAAVPAA